MRPLDEARHRSRYDLINKYMAVDDDTRADVIYHKNEPIAITTVFVK